MEKARVSDCTHALDFSLEYLLSARAGSPTSESARCYCFKTIDFKVRVPNKNIQLMKIHHKPFDFFESLRIFSFPSFFFLGISKLVGLPKSGVSLQSIVNDGFGCRLIIIRRFGVCHISIETQLGRVLSVMSASKNLVLEETIAVFFMLLLRN